MDNPSLKSWAKEHEVTWEVSPWQEIAEGRATSVGLELRLFARHDADTQPSPGCGQCVALYEQLGEIAAAVLPTERHETRYDVDPFDSSFHLRPGRHWLPEVQLAIHITHREDYLSPLDECERRCADEIQQNLRALGAQPRVWSEMAAKQDVKV